MSNARHHRAVQVVLVPVPFEGGSPKNAREVKPDKYPRQDRQPWRPAQAIPRRATKAERTARFIEQIARQDAELRAFMASAREGGRRHG